MFARRHATASRGGSGPAAGSGADVSLHYYLYVSDAKVDMLLPRLDGGFGDRRTGEVGASLKSFNAKRSVEAQGPSRVVRLERVVRHLDDVGDVGTVDDPGPYVRGRPAMDAVRLRALRRRHLRRHRGSGTAWCGCGTCGPGAAGPRRRRTPARNPRGRPPVPTAPRGRCRAGRTVRRGPSAVGRP
ncbi:DUF7019 family protein [Streptomyces tropicalis]|uniref:DUF7019 family protein n=1 Tax=Streptomyces tropicalis TaxID=3034234 RepID=UPI0034D97C89